MEEEVPVIWFGVGIYLLVGLMLGYRLLGIGYLYGGAPYLRPWQLIRGWSQIRVLLLAMVGWFPFVIFVLVKPNR